MFTQEYLKTIINYDPETGIFIWKVFRALICLGHFDTSEEASKAYKEAALKLHGEFAHSILKE